MRTRKIARTKGRIYLRGAIFDLLGMKRFVVGRFTVVVLAGRGDAGRGVAVREARICSDVVVVVGVDVDAGMG